MARVLCTPRVHPLTGMATCHTRLSVTFVHPTQAIEIFGNVSTPFVTLAIPDLSIKILRRLSRGNPSVGELNARGVAKYSDFGPFDAISRKRCKIGAN